MSTKVTKYIMAPADNPQSLRAWLSLVHRGGWTWASIIRCRQFSAIHHIGIRIHPFAKLSVLSMVATNNVLSRPSWRRWGHLQTLIPTKTFVYWWQWPHLFTNTFRPQTNVIEWTQWNGTMSSPLLIRRPFERITNTRYIFKKREQRSWTTMNICEPLGPVLPLINKLWLMLCELEMDCKALGQCGQTTYW